MNGARGIFSAGASALAVVLTLVLGLCACGARTGLDVCSFRDQRACTNACGAGTQTCLGEAWSECDVPPAERACTNACGAGTQTCSEGAWSSCAVPDARRACAVPCGTGEQTCTNDTWSPCIGPEAGAPPLEARLWNFEPLQPPDFGSLLSPDAGSGLDLGIVASTLGADDTPVYAGMPTTWSTHGEASFANWFHDTPINLSETLALPFGPSTADATLYAIKELSFFPVDDALFGNDRIARDPSHNYYFTVAFTLTFRYHGGETFRFASDDDSWVFINRKLAVNLGGLHSAVAGTVNLDAQSAHLGLTVGQAYPLHFFYADRRPISAVLQMQVPAADFAVCSDGGLP